MFWKKKESQPKSGFSKSSKSGFGSAEDDEELEDTRSLWEKLTQPGVAYNATVWFSEFEASDLEANGSTEMKRIHADYLATIEAALDVVEKNSDSEETRVVFSSLKSVAQNYNPQIFPSMELKLSDLEPVEIHDSKLGKKLLSALDLAGIKYLDTSVNELPEEATGVFMRWENTPEGNLNFQYIRIYKTDSGEEIAFWHTPLLASNRWIDYRYVAESKGGDPFAGFDRKRFSSPEGQYNLQWGLPAILKNVAFMAETPFPSTAGMFTFTRDLGFEGVSAKARPKPAFAIVEDELIPFTHSPDDWEVQTLKPSHMTLFGWVLTEDSLKSAEKVFAVVSSGCAYAVHVMEDGESNYADLFTGLDWYTYLRQPVVLADTKPEVYGQRYPAEWMTMPEYSRRHDYIWSNYNDVNSSPSSQERRDGFEDLLQHGADRYVLHAANSLVFGEYLDSVINSEEELETALEILALAFNLDLDNDFGECQSSNALSNSGVVYYQAGNLDLAKRQLLGAIDRSEGIDFDCGSEDEVNYVLSLIYEELGDEDQASEHRQLGEGYNSKDRLRRPGSKHPATPARKAAGKFCTSCGQEFLKVEQKFCSSCGAKR